MMKPMTMRRLAITVLAAWIPTLGQAATQDVHQAFGYDDYAVVLRKYVNDQGLVNYRGLRADRKNLDSFAATLATLDIKIYHRWTDREKIAFWLNAYNALTLKAIVTHYPIQPSFFASLRFPKNSIRQIPGVWDKLRFSVMGREVTLDEIEHETLRRELGEPRIHLALVCAAMGCPPLRNEPYTGDKLEAQFGNQTRRFLQNPLKFRIDQGGGRVHLSSIFKWFRGDFEAGGTSLPAFVSRYMEDPGVTAPDVRIEFLDYDWALNE